MDAWICIHTRICLDLYLHPDMPGSSWIFLDLHLHPDQPASASAPAWVYLHGCVPRSLPHVWEISHRRKQNHDVPTYCQHKQSTMHHAPCRLSPGPSSRHTPPTTHKCTHPYFLVSPPLASPSPHASLHLGGLPLGLHHPALAPPPHTPFHPAGLPLHPTPQT